MTPKLVRLAAASLVLPMTLAGCSFHGLYSTPLPGGAALGSHPITIRAEFHDVLDLVPQSSVKVNDVSVGRVTDITLDGWNAKVTMQINGNVDLPVNARADLEQTSLLGEKYIELSQPADPASQRLADGGAIPLQNTGRNPEVEEILGAISLVLSGGGLSQVQTIVHELNQLLGGRTDQVKDLLTQLNTFVGALDAQKAAITQAIDQVDSLATHLNQQKQTITDTLDTLPQALQVLSSQRSQFVTLLNSLSSFGTVATNVINQSNTNLTADLKQLQPTLTQLAAAGSDLPNSLAFLATAPFPKSITSAIKGDYINVGLTYNKLCAADTFDPMPYGNCPTDIGASFMTELLGGSGAGS